MTSLLVKRATRRYLGVLYLEHLRISYSIDFISEDGRLLHSCKYRAIESFDPCAEEADQTYLFLSCVQSLRRAL